MIINSFKQDRIVNALISNHTQIAYSEYIDLIIKTAENLKQASIGPNDRVAIVSSNNIEFSVLLMALFKAGAIAVPISYQSPQKKQMFLENRIMFFIIQNRHLIVNCQFWS